MGASDESAAGKANRGSETRNQGQGHRPPGTAGGLLMWPDVMLPYCLVTGFPAVGYGPNCGVFAEKPAKRSTLSEVLQGAEETRTQIL